MTGYRQEVQDLVEEAINKKETMLKKVRSLYETNPMLGHRGVRLGITFSEIYIMQIRAILEAEAECRQQGIEVHPKIKVPQVCTAQELLYVKNYVEQVRKSVYGRMIAERKQIAEKFRSEGEGEARKIEGNRDKELKRITSGAYRKAEEIKGKADAEATHIYAHAYSKDPDFYSFVQTLDVYKKTIDKDSSLILSTESDFLKYFKSLRER